MEFISKGSSESVHRDHEKVAIHRVIKFLEELLKEPSTITLRGAINLLKEELK
jgi:hypothetical protein